MGEQYFLVEVNNIPDETEEFIVARFSQETRSLWFYGSWDNEPQAEEIAKFVDGIVVRRINDERV